MLDALDCRRSADPRRRVQQPLRARARRHGPLRPDASTAVAKHFSHLYWGASLAALTRAADRKGLALVGGNRAGNNAFFVRRDALGDIPERTVADCWRPAQFRESRGPDGQLTFLSDDGEKLRLLRDVPLVDLDSDGAERTAGELYGV